ncbi:MAG: hypothetical protein CHACPFDD_02741 [Phycisphaerae bacterium]|nr:hypothetical protein [Phycisphaerae bacterium]
MNRIWFVSTIVCASTLLSAAASPQDKQGQAPDRQSPQKLAAGLRNPDVARLFGHMLERHEAGYPGGKSPLEQRFAAAMARGGISNAFVRNACAKLKPCQAALNRVARNTEIRTLSVQKPAPQKLLRKVLRSKNGVGGTRSLASPSVRYAIRLRGVKSLVCADDVGWERDCDEEEPFVVWSCYGPDYMRSGVTDTGEGVKKGDNWDFRQQVNIFSASPDSIESAVPPPWLLFAYQVIEDDPGGATKDDWRQAFGSASAFAGALFEGNYEEAIDQVDDLLVDAKELIMKLSGGEDDLYPTLSAYFTPQVIAECTSGNTTPPLNSEPFNHPGNYRGLSLQIGRTPENKPHWAVLYEITRR